MKNSRLLIAAKMLLCALVGSSAVPEVQPHASDKSCEEYTAQSPIQGAGIGLFAGRDFKLGDTVDISACVQVATGSTFGTQLHHFVYRAGHGPSEICFGSAMLCNHGDDPNVELQWSESVGSPESASSRLLTVARRDIPAGAELLVSYGSHSWFSTRGIEFSAGSSSLKPQTCEDCEQLCISNVYISDSKIDSAGNGLFSKQFISKGDVIVVSPVLVLPKKRFLRSNLAKYLLAESGEALALLPIGPGAVINHRRGGHNADICWYDSARPAGDRLCAGMPDLLKGGSLSKNELVKQHSAQYSIAYVATRDIAAGEEITLNYGDSFSDDAVNEVLLRGGAEFESSSSPIERRSLFTDDFKRAAYRDTFREDALQAITEMDIGDLRDVFTQRVKNEL